MRFKTTRHRTDQASVPENPQYEVAEFSIKHGLSIIEARRILRGAGTSREEADAAAEQVKEK